MPTLKSIIFETLPDAEEYWETAEALRDLDRQYQHFTRTVWKASKQILKFDEINRLIAYEVEEKEPKVTAGRSSSGGSKSSTKSTTKSAKSSSKKDLPDAPTGSEATLPLYFSIKDVLFNWGDLTWESILAKLISGLYTLSGGLIGATVGGYFGSIPGALIGASLGFLLSCIVNDCIFDFDGKLTAEELKKSLLALLLPLLGALGGFVAGGVPGEMIGLVLGTALSLKVLGLSWQDIHDKIQTFFSDLTTFWGVRWDSFSDLVHGLWDGLRNWWHGLSLDRFTFRLPHLTVEWQELAANSILARYLGITAIPHLGVEWYARGGIVDGATLIGAGEQGREAIIPLERHTEWIHMVAMELSAELQKLAPSVPALQLIPAAAGSLTPYAATLELPSPTAPDLSGLADTIARAIAALGDREQGDPEIRVYLDGKQLSDAVTRYQRRNQRAYGT